MISHTIGATGRRALSVLLVLAAALPVTVTGTASANPGPPVPAPPQQLVPGIPLTPYQPWQLDTPTRRCRPRVRAERGRGRLRTARAADALEDGLIEYVPPSEVVRSAAAAVTCSKRTGPYQRQVERYLKLRVDGRQSGPDCRAIRKFQATQRIRPSIGFAGPVTWSRMRYLAATRNPNAAGKCSTRGYRIACVDLARQLMWVQQGKKVVFGPVPVRTGKHETPTRGGWHRVYWRHKNHFSTLFSTPMPYSQFFSGGQAFHAIYGSVYNPPGSPGCVNMRFSDSRRLWSVLRKGDRVYVWGRRP